MQRYHDNVARVVNTVLLGPVPAATVTVRHYPSLSLANIYAVNDPLTTPILGSTVTADTEGMFQFYAPNGRYNLDVFRAGLLMRTLEDVLIYDPTQGGVGAAPTESIILKMGDETTPIAVQAGFGEYRMPYALVLSGVRAFLTTAQTTGSLVTVDIKQNGVSILSTLITIDNTEKTSTTAATPAVINNPNLLNDAEMTFDVTQVGTGTTAAGLGVTLIGVKPFP